MNILDRVRPEWAIRVPLGLMYLWSGFHIVRDPASWSWAVRALPDFAQAPINLIGIDRFLFVQGVIEIAFGLIFLVWFMPRILVQIAALLSALEMLSITLLVGLDETTFRDIGLFGAGLALFLMNTSTRKEGFRNSAQ